MKILNPIEIKFNPEQDEGQQAYMAERQILKYTNYLVEVANDIDMKLNIVSKKPNFHIQVLDDGIVGEFACCQYSAELYDSFRNWVMIDILFYMKSKSLYLEFDSKLPERKKTKLKFSSKKI